MRMRRLGEGLGETEQQFTIDRVRQSEQSDTLQTEFEEFTLYLYIYLKEDFQEIFTIDRVHQREQSDTLQTENFAIYRLIVCIYKLQNERDILDTKSVDQSCYTGNKIIIDFQENCRLFWGKLSYSRMSVILCQHKEDWAERSNRGK